MMDYTSEHRCPIPSQSTNDHSGLLLHPHIIPICTDLFKLPTLKPYATEATSEPSSRFDARSSESTVL